MIRSKQGIRTLKGLCKVESLSRKGERSLERIGHSKKLEL